MNRDFKGIWIPKEIWLSEKLTMLEKIIFVEIDSLDNENHCTAGNEYFAEFCGCSESKVSKAIKKLKELGWIEVLSFDGRHRKIRVVKSAMQSSKKCYADKQNLQSSNIDSNTDNTNNNSKELLLQKSETNFTFGSKKEKPKKDNLYTRCTALIDDFTDDKVLRADLIEYLNVLLEMGKDGHPLYANVWKGLLKKLGSLSDVSQEQHLIVRQSIERGYRSFFPVSNGWSNNSVKSQPWERGVKSDTYTPEEIEQLKKERAEMEARGEQVWF